MRIRGEIAPQEQFLPFPTIFSTYISNLRSLITYSFVIFGCAICIFLNSENLICRSTDISKCFNGSLRLRDNESRLYILLLHSERPKLYTNLAILSAVGLRNTTLMLYGNFEIIKKAVPENSGWNYKPCIS